MGNGPDIFEDSLAGLSKMGNGPDIFEDSLAGLNKMGNGPDIFEDVLFKIKNAEAHNDELKKSRKQQESANSHLRLRCIIILIIFMQFFN